MENRLSYDGDTDVYHLDVDWDSPESVSTTIVLAVSVLADDESELEPLVDRVDPDALDTLFQSHGDASRYRGHVSFPFGGFHVRVDAGGDVTLRPEPDSA